MDTLFLTTLFTNGWYVLVNMGKYLMSENEENADLTDRVD
jgi:hypothetical protein